MIDIVNGIVKIDYKVNIDVNIIPDHIVVNDIVLKDSRFSLDVKVLDSPHATEDYGTDDGKPYVPGENHPNLKKGNWRQAKHHLFLADFLPYDQTTLDTDAIEKILIPFYENLGHILWRAQGQAKRVPFSQGH